MNNLNFVYFVLATVFVGFIKAEVIYSCTENKTIALTFDDGPHKYTKELVDYLVDNHPEVKATFFHVGRFHYPYAIDVQEYQDSMKKAHDSGLQIASHTFEHKISDNMDEFKKSLDTMDDFIANVTGDKPRYFRAPKGNCKEKCQKSLEEWDYRLIQWDADTNDWDLETSGTIEQRVEDSINFLKKEFAEEKSSYLILMHDSQNYTVRDIAPWIVEKSGMKEKGYRFVTVAECLGDKSGMYRSGKTYGNDVSAVVAGNDTALGNSTDISSENIQQNLESGAMVSSKPIAILFTLCFGLVASLLL